MSNYPTRSRDRERPAKTAAEGSRVQPSIYVEQAPELYIIHAWEWIVENDWAQTGPSMTILMTALNEIAKQSYPKSRWQLIAPCHSQRS